MSKTTTIYLAVWEHKHGVDNSAHTTEAGARKQLAAWARDTIEDWTVYLPEDYDDTGANLTDDELLDSWSEITGETEFMSVQMLRLHHDEVDEKEKWIADTSHIGA